MFTHEQRKGFETRIYRVLAALTDWIEAPEITEPARTKIQNRKRELEAAFLRLRNDNFGFCIACGGQIDESELAGDLAARNCTACRRKAGEQ